MKPGPRNRQLPAAAAVAVLAVCLGSTAVPALAAEPVIASFGDDSVGLDAGCVSSTELRTGTERFVGRPVFGPRENAQVVVVVDVQGPESARIALYDPERRPLGRRSIQAHSCKELEQGLVLALSLMLDFTTEDVERLRETEAATAPSVETAKPPATAAPEPSPPTPDSTARAKQARPVKPTPSASPARPKEPPRVGFHPALDGRLALGFAPVPVWGVGGRFGVLTAEDWLVELHGVYWFPRAFSRDQGGIEYRAIEGGLDLLPVMFQVGPTRTRLGGMVALSRVALAGSGYDEIAAGSALTLRTGLISRLEIDAGPLLAQLSAQLETPLIGHRAVVESEQGAQEQFRVSPVIFTLGAGLAVPFGSL